MSAGPAPSRVGSDLLSWLGRECAALASVPDLRTEADLFADLQAHAVEPLRVAVTGDVSTGKSTLVNALLGRSIALVQREETTSEVTWYRSPSWPAPPTLNPRHRCQPIDFPLADSLVLADTPGVNTVSGNQAASEQLFEASGGIEASAGAVSVLLYLIGGDVSGAALRRIRRFAALTRGPLGEAGNIVLVGAKADETVGLEAGAWEALEKELAVKAGHAGGRSVAVAQLLAATARTGGVDAWMLDHLATVRRWPELRSAADSGWGVLISTARDLADTAPAGGGPALTALAEAVPALGARVGTAAALSCAANALDRSPGDPSAAVRAELERRSGLTALEATLSALAADADLLTAQAVASRLRRLRSSLGSSRGKPVAAILDGLHRHPAAVEHEWRSAALILEGEALRFVPRELRLVGARRLRGDAPPLDPASLRHWERYASSTSRSTLSRRVAELVVEADRDNVDIQPDPLGGGS